MTDHPIIDCDADPFVPEGWRIISHQKGGQLAWDLDEVGVYSTPDQKSPVPVLATEVETELKEMGRIVHNANALDYLIGHPDLLPLEELEWLKEISAGVMFWGTIYANQDDDRCVRCLTLQEDGTLSWSHVRIDHDGLTDSNPASVTIDDDMRSEAALDDFVSAMAG